MKNLLLTAIAIFGLATITLAQVPNYVPTNGLVGWWPFNGNANDESGNGNNGTVNGATLTNDRFGNPNSAYSFDGVDDNIEVISSPILNFGVNPSFTISFWLNKSIISSRGVICKGEPGNPFGWNGWNYFDDDFQTGYPCVNNNFVTAPNIWQFITITVENGTVSSYVNNQFISQFSCVELITNSISTVENMFFGVERGLNQYLFGKLDDIGIWNRVLIQCEIQDLYDSQLGSQAISAGLDQTLCSSDSVTLSASGGSNYQWSNNVLDGQPFVPSQSNAYVVNGTDSLGCQGSDTLMITVLENATSTLNETTLDSYTLNGQTYTESGTYTQTVPAANGCDSVITLNLTLNFTGLSQEESTLFVLYPNPASEQITIKTDAGMIGKEYALYNQVGKLITKGKLTGENTSLSLQGLTRGMYSIAIQGQEKKSFTISKE
jgi:hypothetical protein